MDTPLDNHCYEILSFNPNKWGQINNDNKPVDTNLWTELHLKWGGIQCINNVLQFTCFTSNCVTQHTFVWKEVLEYIQIYDDIRKLFYFEWALQVEYASFTPLVYWYIWTCWEMFNKLRKLSNILTEKQHNWLCNLIIIWHFAINNTAR